MIKTDGRNDVYFNGHLKNTNTNTVFNHDE